MIIFVIALVPIATSTAGCCHFFQVLISSFMVKFYHNNDFGKYKKQSRGHAERSGFSHHKEETMNLTEDASAWDPPPNKGAFGKFSR